MKSSTRQLMKGFAHRRKHHPIGAGKGRDGLARFYQHVRSKRLREDVKKYTPK